MTASNEKIRESVEQYVALVGSGTAEEILALYAEGATVEDPVGSDVLTTRDQIRDFYATLEGLDKQTRLLELRIAAGEAAFCFEVLTRVGEQTYTLAPIDMMTFDDDARIVSMRAMWADSDMVVG